MGDSDGKTVFVGKLDYSASEYDLRDVFEKYGEVESVRIPTDRDSGRPRGFAFVAFTSSQDADEAVRGCDGVEINNRAITCTISKPRSSGGGGYGGGGRGGRGGGRGFRGGRNEYGGGRSYGGRGGGYGGSGYGGGRSYGGGGRDRYSGGGGDSYSGRSNYSGGY